MDNNAEELFRKIPNSKWLYKLVLKLKIKRMVALWDKRRKDSKQRYYKLKEWSQTEKTYLEKLILLRDQVQKPLLEAELITLMESQIIFSNLQSMIQLAGTMREQIDCLLATWHPVRTCLSRTVESLSNYLKIYKEYSTNFQKADSIIQQLKKQSRYREVVTVTSVQDYLIKPVQRPLQYKLFVQDYLRKLPPKHLDSQKLARALDTLLKIADEINDHVEKQMRAQKMVRLEKTFGNLVRNARQYHCQFDALTTEFQCRVYVFNDLLFVVRVLGEYKQEKHMYLGLCGKSYVQLRPNNKSFRNRLFVCGTEESIHLTFRDEADAIKYYGVISELIAIQLERQTKRNIIMTRFKSRKSLQSNKSKQSPYRWKEQYEYRMGLVIEVVGVQKRLYESEWKIVFAVKVSLGKPMEIYQLIFYEISELKNIEKYIKELYPQLQVPSLETKLRGMTYQDFKTDFTKYFEYKSIIIEDFLNFCLRNRQICRKPEYIVYHLKLHECLWDYFNHLPAECKKCSDLPGSLQMKDYYRYMQQASSKETEICMAKSLQIQSLIARTVPKQQLSGLSPNQKLLWSLCTEGRIEYGLQSEATFGKKIGFSVYLKIFNSESEVYIQNVTIYNTCRQVVTQIMHERGIHESLDFGLVYVHGKHEFYLDDDEYIYDIVQHMNESYRATETEKRISLGNRASFLDNFSRSMDDYGDAFRDFSVKQEGKLYVRKTVKHRTGSQLEECKKYPQRYQILLGQLLRRVQSQIMLLNNQELRLYCSLFYTAQQFSKLTSFNQVSITKEQLNSLLPQAKWGAVTQQFVTQVREAAYQQVKHNPKISLLYEEILRQFCDKIGWQTEFFPAEITDPAALNVAERGLLVGISPQRVIVCRKFNTMSLLSFEICELSFRVSGNCLVIVGKQREYWFLGNSWLYFQKLLQTYQNLQEEKPHTELHP